jgi:Undecaprenyl-phosphate glucose phosphotransferase
MLKTHSELFKGLLLASDLCFVSMAWWCAFALRFHTNVFIESEPHVLRHYVTAWLVILAVWAVVFELCDFYRPRRLSTHQHETVELIKASGLAAMVFLGIIFLLRELILSRIVVVVFWFYSLFFLSLSHIFFREALRIARRRGYNLRHVLIIGAAAQVETLLARIKAYRYLGLRVRGLFLLDDADDSKLATDAERIKNPEQLAQMVRSGAIDQVFVALPLEQAAKLREIQEWLGDEPVTLHFVPDLHELATLGGYIEDFDGLQIVTLQSSPLTGWNSLLKRGVDLVVGGLALLICAPVMALVALAIRCSSPGPVLYRQERMGLDGERFQMLKFRTMVNDAERHTGPVWAADEDPRITSLGRWLRHWSFDELPQLINVLRGEMSLVGPRPERPPLIDEFRKTIPKYMLRHKVKAGMTGWAQVHGWRGNTSLANRIKYDLDYIENWSLWRDLKILYLTIVGGFRDDRSRRN